MNTDAGHIVVIADLGHYSARQRVEAFARKAHALEMRLRFFERGHDVRKVVRDGRCAGVFLCNVREAELAHEALRGCSKPIVEASRKLEATWPQVFVDEEDLVEMAFRHFRLLQRESYAYCGRRGMCSSEERERMFRARVAAAGAHFTSVSLDVSADARSRKEIRGFLGRLPRPANLLGFEDRIAEKVLEECEAMGIRVPQDVAVLSCGGDPLLTSIGSHELSSIVIPGEEIGVRSAEILRGLLAGEAPAERVSRVKPLELRVRNSTDPSVSTDPVIAKALTFLRAEIREAPGVDAVARAAGVSRRGLEMRFRQKLDKSVGEQIREFRLERALRLIRSTPKPMERIAEECGFSSAATFSRAFRTWTGTTPSAHRAKVSV